MNLSECTVIELRKLAKDHKVKLGAGLSKAQIIEKLEAALAETPVEAPAVPAVPAAPAPAPVEEAKPQPAAKPAWQAPSAPQYSTKPAYQAPVFPTKPAWQAKSVQPRTPALRPDPTAARPAAAPRPTNYTPRFGPAAVQEPADQPAPQQQSPFAREGDFRQAPRPDYQRPAYRTPNENAFRNYERPAEPAPRPDSYRQDYQPYRQDAPRQEYPAYRQDAYRQEPNRQEGYRQDNGYGARPRPAAPYSAEPSVPQAQDLLSMAECGDGAGLLEIHPDGYGFLRPDNYLPGSKDIYVAMAQIRRFNLRSGDHVVGKTRPQRDGDKYAALVYITEINGAAPDEAAQRPAFDQLTAVYPTRRISFAGAAQDPALRLVDLVAPIGFGQRGLILTPPHAGRTTLLRALSNAIAQSNPNAHVMALLVEERPEEVTEFKDAVQGCEVIATTFDQAPELHCRVADLVMERACRLCEKGQDVILLVDSLSRLAKAYSILPANASRSAPGSINPAVLYKAKRLFGAARALREGGSLTVLATLATDTGSRLDDLLVEEFRDAANMELVLSKELADKDIYPAIHLLKSGTRRGDLLLSDPQKEGLQAIRAVFASANPKDALLQMMDLLDKTATNEELLAKMQDWISLWEKNGFVLQR